MTKKTRKIILVVNDVEATRRSIKEMLERDGYPVITLRDAADAAEKSGCLKEIELILISLEGEIKTVISAAERIRKIANRNQNTPIIIFCDGKEREEASFIGRGIYFSCPDDFNQLRKLIERILIKFQEATSV